mmetsp:Transcript_74008/g.158629  ORF Transcript_74008/g.158629 Transcript_74008/m.158629 type:complete len:121 (+) Transcript_74008:101-463(+)
MGCCGGKQKEVSDGTKKVLEELFNKIDFNHDKAITKEEALKYWQGTFAKANVKAMFGNADADKGGTVSKEEFDLFWKHVLNSGYTDSEIAEEAKKIIDGETWKDWAGVSLTDVRVTSSKE